MVHIVSAKLEKHFFCHFMHGCWQEELMLRPDGFTMPLVGLFSCPVLIDLSGFMCSKPAILLSTRKCKRDSMNPNHFSFASAVSLGFFIFSSRLFI